MKEYVTIAEYARTKGISRQAVYKQLTSQLTEFVNEVDGKKVLSINALTDSEREQVDREVNKKVDRVEQLESTTSQLIEMLQKELAAKDQQIEELHRLLLLSEQTVRDQSQKIMMLEAPKEPKKKRWWSWLFES